MSLIISKNVQVSLPQKNYKISENYLTNHLHGQKSNEIGTVLKKYFIFIMSYQKRR